MWVTHSRMLCSIPRSCLVHPVDCFDSEGWFSSDHVIFLTMFCVFGKRKHAAFKWKDAISEFPVFRGSALVRWGGKMKCVLIAYFLGNILPKIVAIKHVCKHYSKSKVGLFWDTCSSLRNGQDVFDIFGVWYERAMTSSVNADCGGV